MTKTNEETDSFPYLVLTERGYMVSGPDKDGEIEIEKDDRDFSYFLYLSAVDLRMMLERIERSNTALRGEPEKDEND